MLSAEDIAKSAARTVPDLLAEQVGITLKDFFGNNASVTSVDMRGFGVTGGQNTLILLDGRRITDIDLSSVQWSSVPLSSIERIEILRGTGSVLYGDGASAGVINIVTRSPLQPGVRAEMYGRLSRAKAPRSWEWALGKGYSALTPHNLFHHRRAGHLVDLVRGQPAGWFERGWPEEMAEALSASVRRLTTKHGAGPAGWEWGAVRPLTLLHPFGARKPLGRVFNLGPFPWGGDQNTVAQCGADPIDPAANPPVIQSLRMIVDLGNFADSRWVLPGGQSGNPLSAHYADQLPLWRAGEGIPIPFSPQEVTAASRHRLSLVPSPG